MSQILRKGTVSPARRNLGILTDGPAIYDVWRFASGLSEALSEEYNVFVILCGRGSAGFGKRVAGDAAGTVLDMNGGMSAAGLKLTKSQPIINRLIKENNLALLVSAGARANGINGIYNHSCPSVLCIAGSGTGHDGIGDRDPLRHPLSWLERRAFRDAERKADYRIQMRAGVGTKETINHCSAKIKEIMESIK